MEVAGLGVCWEGEYPVERVASGVVGGLESHPVVASCPGIADTCPAEKQNSMLIVRITKQAVKKNSAVKFHIKIVHRLLHPINQNSIIDMKQYSVNV